jgi:hypothetical protein
VIGVARAARTDEHFKERVRDCIQQQGGEIDQEALAARGESLDSPAKKIFVIHSHRS